MTISETVFRQLMSQFASGVVILTVKQEDICHGITVSSFCSLSLDPPKILACVNQNSFFLDLLGQTRIFGINILDENGEWLSRHFASRSISKFNGIPYSLSQHGIPLLAGVLATIECRLDSQFPGGDHVILTGDVLNAEITRYTQPLIYFRRNYKQLMPDGLPQESFLSRPLLGAIPGS
jgi:flavin reductase (DIM6/NTAB) family NADH-FMN oxidoreductase RutF